METSIVKVRMQRGEYNVLSAITVHGDRTYSIKYDMIDWRSYLEFSEEIISNRERHLILLVDRATFHGSKEARAFVQYIGEN